MNYLQRKRLILMRAGKFKGYLRTASGGLPLALAKCMNDYPVSIEASGKTTQSGTPAPDTPADIVSLGEKALISGDYASTYAVFRISVIEDTSVTAETFKYEPFREPVTHNIYLPEQINGINGLTDTVKLDVENKTAELNKQFGVKVFDGSESWSIQSVNEYGITNFRCALSDKAPENSNDVMCSHYQIQTSVIAGTQTDGVMVTNNVCYVRSAQYSTVDEFKSWLTEQYEAGSPLTVVYRLNTPALTDISSLQDWDIPKLHSGTNVITIETEPSMAVTYYSTVKESETS